MSGIATDVIGHRTREFVVVGMAVVGIGVGLVVAALCGGKQNTGFGIENLVAHIDFRIAVAVEVGKTDAYGEVVVSCVIALVGDPNGIAGMGCRDVVGVQFGVFAGGHNVEKAGLVTRTRGKEDSRQRIVSLTEKGHAMRKQAAGIHESMRKEITLEWGEEKEMIPTLDKLIEELLKLNK